MRIALIGCGNMTSVLANGMFASNSDIELHCYNPTTSKAEILAKQVKGDFWESLDEMPSCEFYLIGCKPQQFSICASELISNIPKDVTIISIMAGVSCETIEKSLKIKSIVRIMPNTPSLVNAGVNLFYSTGIKNKESYNNLVDLFRIFSHVQIFDDEKQIDLMAPLSGSGPAYFFEFARILSNWAVGKGIDRKVAEDIVKHTILGSGKLLLNSDKSAEVLRKEVTSKGGITEQALNTFTESGLESTIVKALESAYEHGKKL
jgi:pyrroline-5-carboxylate reductase